MIRIFILLLLPLSVFCQPEELNDSANFYFEKGQFAKSATFFDIIIETGLATSDQYYLAACASAQSGKKERAINLLIASFELNDNDHQWMYYDPYLNPIRKEDKYRVFEENFKNDSTLYYDDIIRQLSEKRNVKIANKELILYPEELYSLQNVRDRWPEFDELEFPDSELEILNCTFSSTKM